MPGVHCQPPLSDAQLVGRAWRGVTRDSGGIGSGDVVAVVTIVGSFDVSGYDDRNLSSSGPAPGSVWASFGFLRRLA